MTSSANLSDAKVLLLATRLAAEGQIDVLRRLVNQRADILRDHIVYRVLFSYCTQDIPSQDLALLLKDLQHGSQDVDSAGAAIDVSFVQELDEPTVRKQVRNLNLPPLPECPEVSENNLLLRFLLARAHQLDLSGDDLIPLAELVVPFLQSNEAVQNWFLTRLRPLLRLKYEFYPGSDVTLTLQELDHLEGRPGVSDLLQYAERESTKAEIGRDLRSVVAPWIRGANVAKRRKVEVVEEQQEDKTGHAGWQDVNEWILATSLNDFGLAEKAYTQWNGPGDVDLGGYQTVTGQSLDDERLRFGQLGIAMIYAAPELGSEPSTRLQQYRTVLGRASTIVEPRLPNRKEPKRHAITPQSSKAALLQNALLTPNNELTWPSRDCVAILQDMIESASGLVTLKSPLAVRQVAELALFGTEEQQRQELRRIIQKISQIRTNQRDWELIREQILALQTRGPARSENPAGGEGRALLGRLKSRELELEILSAMLSAGQYDVAVGVYANQDGPLPLSEVEDCVKTAIFKAYDNASNGNRTRGGILRSYEILKAFQPRFPQSTAFREIGKLIAATHSLSFYQLTLQHGVPFQPVDIRVRKDPLSLIEKVLEQNHKAYTKLDDLLGIGRNLVEAGLALPESKPSESESVESRIFDAEHRIIYLAITSALSSDDFQTAYSYITTRLSQSTSYSPSTSQFVDDTSWRAAFSAGRYRPASTPTSLQLQITNLSRRMELLSLALTLAPNPDPLPEILAVWRLSEDEMDALKSREADQIRSFEEKAANRISLTGSSVIPGGFGGSEELDREDDIAETQARLEGRRRAEGQKSSGSQRGSALSSGLGYGDEAPMGLFDVARGAANAFQRSTRGVWGNNQGQKSDGHRTRSLQLGATTRDLSPDGPATTAADFAGTGVPGGRKRDRISGMVTGGLVSGIGWVLGAQPLGKVQDRMSESEDADD